VRCSRCYANAADHATHCPGCGLGLGRELAEAGADLAEAAASPEWKAAANAALDRLIASGSEFTTDDIWAEVGACTGSDPRALGSLIRARSKQKRIVRVGLRESTRPACHARPVTVWVAS